MINERKKLYVSGLLFASIVSIYICFDKFLIFHLFLAPLKMSYSAACEYVCVCVSLTPSLKLLGRFQQSFWCIDGRQGSKVKVTDAENTEMVKLSEKGFKSWLYKIFWQYYLLLKHFTLPLLNRWPYRAYLASCFQRNFSWLDSQIMWSKWNKSILYNIWNHGAILKFVLGDIVKHPRWPLSI